MFTFTSNLCTMTIKERIQVLLKPKSTLEKIIIAIMGIYLIGTLIVSIVALIGHSNSPDWWFLKSKFSLFINKWNSLIIVWLLFVMVLNFIAMQFIYIRKMKSLQKFQEFHSKNGMRIEIYTELQQYFAKNLKDNKLILGSDLMDYLSERIEKDLKQTDQLINEIKPNE